MKRPSAVVMWVGILVVVLAGLAISFWLWLADRPTDVPAPPPSVFGLVFNPQFGPKTPKEAKEYVEERVRKTWQGMFLKQMQPEDLNSGWGKQFQADAIGTLMDRWGITLGMTQKEIDIVYDQQQLVWAYVQQSKTWRHKVRSYLGVAK